MRKDNTKFDHLIKNLERISNKNSIFNYDSGRKAFLSLGKGNIQEWLEILLPNTRLIIEPKIIGSIIGIQYINGKLKKAIDKKSIDITTKVNSIKNIPKSIPVKKRIEIQGVLYENVNRNDNNKIKGVFGAQRVSTEIKENKFCAFQIFHCKINHFQALQELNNLNFEIPQTQFTKFISEIEIYRQCWKDGKLFTGYPSSGLVLKINSRKLQKYLIENNLTIHWAFAIN